MIEYRGDVQRDLLIPLGRALIGGLLVGVGLLTIAILAGWSKVWVWFFAGWALATIFEWFRHSQHTITILERWLDIDLNQDGTIGSEPVIIEPPQITQIEIISDNGRRSEFLDLPIPPDVTAEAAKLLTNGADFSHALSGPNQIFTRSEWERFRDELILRGYARWKNERAHNLGAQLTAKGRAAIKGYAMLADVARLQDGD